MKQVNLPHRRVQATAAAILVERAVGDLIPAPGRSKAGQLFLAILPAWFIE